MQVIRDELPAYLNRQALLEFFERQTGADNRTEEIFHSSRGRLILLKIVIG
jgi:hypothetical protein